MASLTQIGMAVSFALPCFAMGGRLHRVWRTPMAVESGRWVGLGVGIFVLEFVLQHAGVGLGVVAARSGSTGSRALVMLGMTAFYALFAGAIALGFRSRMLLQSFAWMIGWRFFGLFVGISAQEAGLLTAHAVLGIIVYFVMVLASVFAPIPRRGITAEVAIATRVPNATGTWAEEPHRAIGAATIYFLLLGVLELAVMTWVDPAVLQPH